MTAAWCVTCAVEPSLQNTVQRSVIPSGHASKQDVDLLMWFYAEGAWQVCHGKYCYWRNSGTQSSMACLLGYGVVLAEMAQDSGSYSIYKKKRKFTLKPLNYCFPKHIVGSDLMCREAYSNITLMLQFLSVLGWRYKIFSSWINKSSDWHLDEEDHSRMIGVHFYRIE